MSEDFLRCPLLAIDRDPSGRKVVHNVVNQSDHAMKPKEVQPDHFQAFSTARPFSFASLLACWQRKKTEMNSSQESMTDSLAKD